MAIDFKKEIGKGSLKKNKAVYPTKTTINLAYDKKSDIPVSKAVPAIAVILLAVLVFGKFGVVDVLGRSAAGNQRADSAQMELDLLTAENADFEKVSEEYYSFTANSLSNEEVTLVSRSKVLDMLDRDVASVVDVRSLKVTGAQVVVQFAGSNLNSASRVVANLEKNKLVKSVSVSTATTEDDDKAVLTTATITLVGGTGMQEEGKES